MGQTRPEFTLFSGVELVVFPGPDHKFVFKTLSCWVKFFLV